MVLSIIKAALGALGFAIPGFGPKTFMAVASVLLAGLIGGGCYLWGRGNTQAEIAANDIRWIIELQKVKQTHANELRDARRAAELEPPTPDDRAERLQLCRQSPTCREHSAGSHKN